MRRHRHHDPLFALSVNLVLWVGVILPLKACFVALMSLPVAVVGARRSLRRAKLRIMRAYLIWKSRA